MGLKLKRHWLPFYQDSRPEVWIIKKFFKVKLGKQHGNEKMRGDKIPTVRGSRWKYPFLPNNVVKEAGQQGHDTDAKGKGGFYWLALWEMGGTIFTTL